MEKTKRLIALEQKVEELYQKADDKAIIKAILKLGEEYGRLRHRFSRKGSTPEWLIDGLEKVVNWYDHYAIDKDGKYAVYQLAQAYVDNKCENKGKRVCELYINFLGLEYNLEKWSALNNLACRFEDGDGVEKDIHLALGIFKLLAHIGTSYGRLNLAEYLEEGKGIEKNLDKAIELYKELVKNYWHDGTKEIARERLTKHGYTEYALDELENDWRIEHITSYMNGNLVWIELDGNHIRKRSVDIQDATLVESLQDEGIITDKTRELFKILKRGEHRQSGIGNRDDYYLPHIQMQEIDVVRRFRPQFGAWADAWEKIIKILEQERGSGTDERNDYYFIVKRPNHVDVSGLRVIGTIQKAVEDVRKSKPAFDIESINYSDKEVFNFLSGGDELLGVFQLESEGMQKFLRDLLPDSLDDIVAAIALYRPGAMDWIPQFIKGKHCPDESEYIAECVKPILCETHGVILYQEQVIRILTDIGGFKEEKADYARREISKTKHKTIEKVKDAFILGASGKDIPDETSIKIFDELVKSAPYLDLKAHATARAYLAYQTAYLSHYYPIEYYSACIENAIEYEVEKYKERLNKAKSGG